MKTRLSVLVIALLGLLTGIPSYSRSEDNQVDGGPPRGIGERCGGEYKIKTCRSGLVCGARGYGQMGYCLAKDDSAQGDVAAEKELKEITAAIISKADRNMYAFLIYRNSEGDARNTYHSITRKGFGEIAGQGLNPSQKLVEHLKYNVAQELYMLLIGKLRCIIETPSDDGVSLSYCKQKILDLSREFSQFHRDYGQRLASKEGHIVCEAKARMMGLERQFPPYPFWSSELTGSLKAIDPDVYLECIKLRL